MVTEDYVSFETAKLLKENGFDGECIAYYSEFKDNNTNLHRWRNRSNYVNVKNSGYTLVPTLQMAMKWLRDVHKKVINVEYIDFLEHGEVWSYSVLDRNTFHKFTEKSESFTEHSYEEACEEGIKYCLKNLI